MDARALVFTGGKGPAGPDFVGTAIPSCSYVCAADSGIDTALAMGYRVDYAVGDFDSVSGIELLKDLPHTRLPREKDLTDTEALLMHLAKRGYASYVLVGGGEGRFDHLLHLYTLFSVYGPPELWITAEERMHLVRAGRTFLLPLGTTISVIPALARGNSAVSSRNLRWELHAYPVSMDRQSISNITCGETVSLTVTGSPVFVSIPFHREKYP